MYHFARLIFVSVAVLTAGCGGGTKRSPIFGSLVGAEGRTGVLTLMPTTVTKGPAATTSVTDGKYEFDKETGPYAGEYEAHVLLDRINAPAVDSASINKDPKRGAMASNPLHPNSEQKVIMVTVPDKAPWQLDIRWK